MQILKLQVIKKIKKQIITYNYILTNIKNGMKNLNNQSFIKIMILRDVLEIRNFIIQLKIKLKIKEQQRLYLHK